ncbi:putative transcription regulator protein [Liberibacter crescens BT-1]|uniref:diguanylate cyclase n=1 Tax=Liberibacter crescens (strain BT-1) TaxID=1215343 RepID=L0ET10_LIBCB|nr:diguanylate cyclase [Liberibacter crescens]AGA64072.1 putative transcription regulator protein [Liberibacter crescens BT-1]AMC12363.1 hypothetical protein RL73_00565 [Liberibacter crescens]
MTSRVLIVSDIQNRTKMLEVYLRKEYFEVITVLNALEALAMCQSVKIDVIVIDVNIFDAFEICERIKSYYSIPIAMIVKDCEQLSRLKGLKSSVDDFLIESIDDLQLIYRINNLLNYKKLIDEVHFFSQKFGFQSIESFLHSRRDRLEIPDLILLMDVHRSSQEDLVKLLKPIGDVVVFSELQAEAYAAIEQYFGLIIVNTIGADFNSLHLCSQLRLLEKIRFVPVLLIIAPDDLKNALKSLKLGMDDYILYPIEPNEFIVRCLMQIRRKRLQEVLITVIKETVQQPITDPLTGLKNRNYLENCLDDLFNLARLEERSLSLILTDIDRLQAINGIYGNTAGDNLLCEFASRVCAVACFDDIIFRYEEDGFLLVMPNTPIELATSIVNILRMSIENTPFILLPDLKRSITASFGVSSISKDMKSSQHLLNSSISSLHQDKLINKLVLT